jgi:hypothetical protein
VICEEDQALAPAAQEQLAKRATNIRRLPSSHSPMLSQPAEVAQIIADAAMQVIDGPVSASTTTNSAIRAAIPLETRRALSTDC